MLLLNKSKEMERFKKYENLDELMSSYLATTTLRNRSYDRMEMARDEAIKLGMYNPTIINVGPGGLVSFLFDCFPIGKPENFTQQQKLVRAIMKLIENPLRKTNLFGLESSEPKEITETFKELEPKKIYVVDIERKVIEAVRNMVTRDNLPPIFDYLQIDLETEQIPFQGEIVIAYAVVPVTNDRKKALDTIANSVAPGGLLSIDMDLEIRGFKRANDGLYVKDK
jgi:hypothetical protein